MEAKTYLDALKKGMESLLSEDSDIFLIGEDIAEPYGGAFKVTKGLSDKFPDRLIQTPMSEQGFTGMAVGMALTGLKPIVEIMFGDFITLTVDQIVNHASKFHWLYKQNLHFVVRTPMGGYRGYGATHSQSLEKLFIGLPHITVLSPSVVENPADLLRQAIYLGEPVIFVENKLDYTKKLFEYSANRNLFAIKKYEDFPATELILKDEPEYELTLITYGGMVQKAIDIQIELFMEEEISIRLLAMSKISPVDFGGLYEICKADENLLILEEGHSPFGWSDGIVSQLAQLGFRGNIKSVGAKISVIGAADSLEKYVLPEDKAIYNSIVEMVE